MAFRYIWVLFLFFVCARTIPLIVAQTIRGPDDVVVEQGDSFELSCEDMSGTTRGFIWNDITANEPVYSGTTKSDNPKYANFNLETTSDSLSVLSINGTEIEDEGEYQCQLFGLTEKFDAAVTVEVRSTMTLTLPDTLEENVEATFQCSAIGGRPLESVSFYIVAAENGAESGPLSGVSTTSTPNTDTNLTDTTATLTYNPTRNDQTLSCRITGHQVADLNQQQNELLNVSYGLEASALSVTINDSSADQLVITCVTTYETNPPINDYLILQNSSDVISNSSLNSATLNLKPSYDIEFTCSVTNGIGDRTIVSATYLAQYVGATDETFSSKGTTTNSPVHSATDKPFSPEEPMTNSRVPSGARVSASAVAGGICGGIVVIILIIALVVFLIHNKVPKEATSITSVSGAQNENRAYEIIDIVTGSTPNTTTTYTALRTVYNADTPIPAGDVTRLGSIGSGDFGDVWKGELRSPQGPTAVAIRQIRGNHSTITRQAVGTLTSLNDHPNVVKCIGYCDEQQSILYEFVSGGTLLAHLQSGSTHSDRKVNRSHVDEASLVKFAWQIAKGMEFLASKQIVNGALCAHNVLMTASKLCKISDYGLLSLSSVKKIKHTRWSSPEMLQNGPCSGEGDVWTFGIVLWEIVTLGANPYPHMNFTRVNEDVTNGYKMPCPRHCGEQLYNIMVKCWNGEPKKRPTFSRVLQEIEKLMEQTHDYISLDQLDTGLYDSAASLL